MIYILTESSNLSLIFLAEIDRIKEDLRYLAGNTSQNIANLAGNISQDIAKLEATHRNEMNTANHEHRTELARVQHLLMDENNVLEAIQVIF